MSCVTPSRVPSASELLDVRPNIRTFVAETFVDGEYVGITPVSVDVNGGERHLIRVQKVGYYLETENTSTKLSAIGTLDIIAGVVVSPLSWLGLLSPGAWDVDRQSITIDLKRAPPGYGVTEDQMHGSPISDDLKEGPPRKEWLAQLAESIKAQTPKLSGSSIEISRTKKEKGRWKTHIYFRGVRTRFGDRIDYRYTVYTVGHRQVQPIQKKKV